jgi:hypothetical protein
MANELGRYTGETIIGTIGENVGLGQIVYSRTITTANPDVIKKGVWFPAACDILNEIIIQPGDQPKWAGSNQLGVVVEAATYSAITSTQSGTQTTILLKGYYSPGLMVQPGSTSSNPDGYYYVSPGTSCGGPLYLMPKITKLYPGTPSKDTRGGFSNYLPNSSALGGGPDMGATQGAARIIGYAFDLNYPYVVRFEPDNTWIEFGN